MFRGLWANLRRFASRRWRRRPRGSTRWRRRISSPVGASWVSLIEWRRRNEPRFARFDCWTSKTRSFSFRIWNWSWTKSPIVGSTWTPSNSTIEQPTLESGRPGSGGTTRGWLNTPWVFEGKPMKDKCLTFLKVFFSGIQSNPCKMFYFQPLRPSRPSILKTIVTLLCYFLKFYNFVLNDIVVGSTSSELQHPWISKIRGEPKKIPKS